MKGFTVTFLYTSAACMGPVRPIVVRRPVIRIPHHQAAAKTVFTRIFAVDGRVGAGQYQRAFILQGLQALQVIGACFQAILQAVGLVLAIMAYSITGFPRVFL